MGQALAFSLVPHELLGSVTDELLVLGLEGGCFDQVQALSWRPIVALDDPIELWDDLGERPDPFDLTLDEVLHEKINMAMLSNGGIFLNLLKALV